MDKDRITQREVAKKSGTGWAVRLLIAAGVFLIMIFLLSAPGIFAPVGERSEDASQRQSKVEVENPEQFMGSMVDLIGDVDRVVNDRVFIIDGPGILGDRLLVITRVPLERVDENDLSALENSEVEVSGVVREMNLAQLQQELGIDLDREDFRDWEGRPIVVAEAVNVSR